MLERWSSNLESSGHHCDYSHALSSSMTKKMLESSGMINARRTCARGVSIYFVCVSRCVSVPSLLLSNRAYDFQFIGLSKMPSFPRKSAFHGYFVVPIHINGSVSSTTCDLPVTWSTVILYRVHPTNAGYVVLG